MARAALQYMRTGREAWRPVGVWLATPTTLVSRYLTTAGLDEYAARLRQRAVAKGSWEDWIDDALRYLSNGADLHVTEVAPELTVDMLYAREVLGLDAAGVASAGPQRVEVTEGT